MVGSEEYSRDSSLGEYEDWVREQTPEITAENLSRRARYLWQVFLLKKGGFPLGAEDLEPEDWTALGAMELIFGKIDLEMMATAIWGKPN